MFKDSKPLTRDINSSEMNSEDDANKFSEDESDDENPPRSFVNPSYNEKQINSFNTSFSATGSNDHSNDVTRVTDNWSSKYSISNNWNYKAKSNKRTPQLKINLSKVKKVKIKKPSVGISRRKSNSSSPFNVSFLKKRPKYLQSHAIKKRMLPKSHSKNPLVAQKGVNGLSDENVAIALRAEPNSNEVPTLPSVSPSYSWANKTKGAENVSDDGEANVDEYTQYLELKPSVKFKCYRCGTNDFSSMASLQGHIATCSGPTHDSINHSSPVRTMKPSAAPPTTSPNLRITRQVYLCSSCGTYYQNYNLYIHMRDKHNKQICLFCRSIFSRSEELWDHLVSTHKLNSIKYSCASQIRNAFKSSFYITCCSCNSIFSDNEPFNEHNCDVDNRLNVIDTSVCTNCKPGTISTDGGENSITTPANTLAESPRRESVTSLEDDDESKTEFQDKFLSRNSTLDFIGVPEDHTLTSLPEEPNDVEELETVPEKINELVPEVTPLTEEHLPDVAESDDGITASANDTSSDHKLSSPHSNADESIHESESESVATNAVETSASISERPMDENCGDYLASTKDIANSDEKSATSSDENSEVNVTEPLEADDSIVAKTDGTTTEYVDTDCTKTEDVKPNVETPPLEPVDVIPAPLPMALMLDETVDSLSVAALIKECVRTSCLSCLYCSNATLIAVNGANLVAHLLAEHRFMPTKHEDDSQMVIRKLESGTNDLINVHMNATYSTHREITFDGTFACLQCSFTTPLFKDLCHHKRRMHHKIIFLCIMCKCNFQFYSQLLCHLCPGVYLSENLHTLKYHCCFCEVDLIPSAFRLMVHLRKVHQACDICLSRHADQSELYTHMIKQHKINHLCYKCNLAWRSRDDINKHLFWKHGTESVLCKRCLQKKWPHAYHFCIPASTYTCDECSRIFSKAVALTVHRRAHNGEFPFACDLCEQRCISKKLLAAHKEVAHHILREPRPDVSKGAQPCEASVENHLEEQPAKEALSGTDESKDRRSKKKRKKSKNGNEKPLLDELPPLNLSSESENESGDEEQPATKMDTASTSVEPTTLPSLSPLSPSSDVKQPNLIITETSADATEMPVSMVETPVDSVEAAAAAENDRQEVSAILNELAMAAVAVSSPSSKLVATTEAEKVAESVETLETEEPSSVENTSQIEKMLNCLIVEHSYCIPDSIFRSSDVANQSAMSEGSDNAASGKQHSKRDKSCSKSITPRKRKHPPKKESSSSDSSSDTDSSSSSCGSNCSCNKSGVSNCSSSSSSESTTPEKRTSIKKKPPSSPSNDKSSPNTTTDAGAVGEQSLLSVPESDLDTDITVSDEDFYEEHPFYVPPPPAPTEPEPVAPTGPLPYENKLTISREMTQLHNECKSKKRKKKPKITISLGGLQSSYNTPKAFGQSMVATNTSVNTSSSLDHRISSSSFDSYTSTTPNATNSVPHYKLSAAMYSNCVSSTTGPGVSPALPTPSGGGSDSAGRLSKRKRVKNRFYGYSSSDENSGHESLKIIQLKKRPPSKKPKSRPGFLSIRTKRPPNLVIKPPMQFQQHSPSISSTTGGYPSAASNLYRVSSTPANNLYRPSQPQQRNFLKPVVPESSDDSDSDEKRHKLVINLPTSKEKQNNRLSYGFSNADSLMGSSGNVSRGGDAYAGSSWFSQRPSHVAQHQQQSQLPSATQSTPTKKEIYCFCRCPYDEVSEMIACDAPNCPIEWFHFECVGIMAAPQGQWFCPNCRKNPENISRSF